MHTFLSYKNWNRAAMFSSDDDPLKSVCRVFFSTSESAQLTSSCGSEVSLDENADKGMLATSPSPAPIKENDLGQTNLCQLHPGFSRGTFQE